MPTLNLNSNLSEAQRSSITNLLGSGRTLNETDARNLAYATGQSNNWQQFVNQSASNYSIGNLAQFAPPATSNINPTNGSTGTIPNLGQSTMGSYFNNQVVTGLSQFEQSILNYTQQQEALRQQRETEAQSQYDQAFAGLEQAQTGESGEALMRRLMAEQGIQDKQNQLVEFQKQLATLQNQYTVANNAIGNLPINTAIIRGQQYLKQQEFAAKATLIQARGAIVEGQLNFAQDLVKGYYEAASVDRQNQISRYQNLLSLADQKLVRLNADEKENLNMMISTLQSAEQRQQDNRDKISALMLDPVAAAAWSKTPGLSLDMNYNDIVSRLLPQIVAENTRIETMKNVRTGGSAGKVVGSGNPTGKDLTADARAVAQYLVGLRDSGQLNDNNYSQKISQLMDAYNIDPSQYDAYSSMINNMMAGSQAGTSAPQNVVDTASDFSTSPSYLTTNPAQQIGEAIWKTPTWIGKRVLTAPGKLGTYLTTPKKKKK